MRKSIPVAAAISEAVVSPTRASPRLAEESKEKDCSKKSGIRR